MRKRIIIVLLLASVVGFAQQPSTADEQGAALSVRTQHYLDLFLRPDVCGTSIATEKIPRFIRDLENKKSVFKNDKDFLHYLFQKTHRKFLRHYKDYCTFDDLLNEETYNCLTGTALYALLLDHFDVAYEIVETNYHIFLMIKSTEGDLLFEATDEENGFVDSPIDIENRTNKYKALQPIAGRKICYRYAFEFFNTINLEALVGLMYYNLSVDAYNNRMFSASIYYLDQATRFYQTERTEEFSRIILHRIIQTTFLNKNEKEAYLKNLLSIRKKNFALASID